MIDKPYRPNVGIALFNNDGRVLIARRIRDDGPEVIYPGAEWQMPQGGIDAAEDPRAAALRELFEETGVMSADYLGETDWLTYEFPPYDARPAAEMVRDAICRRRERDRSTDLAQWRGAGIRSVALGKA
jgi:putative (di)nucleoside polyphosphate hydrolase